MTLHVDGGARGNPGPAAAGVVLHDSRGQAILEAGYVLGSLTNNQAEYQALVIGLQAAIRRGAQQLSIYSDSQLLVRQIIGRYQVRAKDLKPLHEQVQQHLLQLNSWNINHVDRANNRRADELVNRALDAARDVVEVEVENGFAAAEDEAHAAIELRARVIETGPTDPCPGCQAGREYVVGETFPGGLSVEAATAVLQAARELRRDRHRRRTLRVVCDRCQAVFEVGPAARG